MKEEKREESKGKLSKGGEEEYKKNPGLETEGVMSRKGENWKMYRIVKWVLSH
ncbi:hypothetical protein ACFPC0_27795 [Streptomyces andamanensis]|uniref:Uncharacterized protein n=1 Tax=Streptomyces andamanensis TaxID=1565035 RepID=A0ABV8TLD0_9ACTN